MTVQLSYLGITITIGIFGIMISGCSPIASSYLIDSEPPNGQALVGPIYNLPIKKMSVSIGSNGFGLFVAVHDIRIEGDSSASYVLSYNADSSSADKIDISVNPETGLLSAVKMEADSKAADATKALGKTVGQFAGAFESSRTGKTRLYAIRPLIYWPRMGMTTAEAKNGLAKLNAEVNATLREVVKVHGCDLKDEAVLSPVKRKTVCGASDVDIPQVTLEIEYTPYVAKASEVNCTVGICTRKQNIAQMTLMTNGSIDSERVPLPNGSSPVPLPLYREAFSKVTTNYTLVDGLLSNSFYEKGAALPEIFALPGNLVGSVIGGVVDGIAEAGKLRKARSEAEGNKDKDNKEKGQNELNRTSPNETAFDASLVMMVYPLPQLGNDVPGADTSGTSSHRSAADGTQTLKGADDTNLSNGTRTTTPGPAKSNAGPALR